MHTYQDIITNKSILNTFKSTEPVPLICEHCSKIYYKNKNYVLCALKEGLKHNYCTVQCKGLSTVVKHSVTCLQCDKIFEKANSEVRKSPNHFCSKSCAAIYNNKRKVKAVKVVKVVKTNQHILEIKQKQKKPRIVKEKKWSLTKATSNICKIFLGITDSDYIITEVEYEKVRTLVNEHLHIDNLSPREINEKYSIGYASDFGTYIKLCLKVELKTLKNSIKNFNDKTGRTITDEKLIYKDACKFLFNINKVTNIPGKSLIKEYGWYHSKKNLKGVSRDHMFSVAEGYKQGVPPEIISHPANCHIITQSANSSKGYNCSITLEELYIRITHWDSDKKLNSPSTNQQFTRSPMSESTKLKLSQAARKYFNITNGTKNMKCIKGKPIPDGFYRGLTKNRKIIN